MHPLVSGWRYGKDENNSFLIIANFNSCSIGKDSDCVHVYSLIGLSSCLIQRSIERDRGVPVPFARYLANGRSNLPYPNTASRAARIGRVRVRVPDEDLRRWRGIGYSRATISWTGAWREKNELVLGKMAFLPSLCRRANRENKKAILADGIIACI